MALQLSDEVLLRVMEDLDSETVAHSGRVQALAVVLGETMGLTPTELHQLRLGAHIHDIGKKFIPHRILVKKEPLTPDELVTAAIRMYDRVLLGAETRYATIKHGVN